MEIRLLTTTINKGADLIIQLLQDEFKINETIAEQIYETQIKSHFDNLKDGLTLVAETNYIDKFYSDSYYTFFSKKLNQIKKECFRISIFDGEISEDDFLNSAGIAIIKERFLGNFVFRPTTPRVLGRSLISPLALKTKIDKCCVATFDTSCFGIKLTVRAFPFSTQDRETITCAETTLWGIMEYFSHKYAEYQPTLPSRIVSKLTNLFNERQLPSKGLHINHISYSLKEFGFGSKIYMKAEYLHEFDRILNIYLDSGIPVIIAIDNSSSNGNIGHALIAIGIQNPKEEDIDKLNGCMYADDIEKLLEKRDFNLLEYSHLECDLVVNDDNTPSYSLIDKNRPGRNYTETEWDKCEIAGFIVPLNHKVNLDALMAKNLIINFLCNKEYGIKDNGEYIFRVFMTSSRTYKDYISSCDTIEEKVKVAIIQCPMPKFIYVGELTSKSNIKKELINGMVIVDATESNIYNNKPILIAVIDKELLIKDIDSGIFESYSILLQNIEMFNKNFKPLI